MPLIRLKVRRIHSANKMNDFEFVEREVTEIFSLILNTQTIKYIYEDEWTSKPLIVLNDGESFLVENYHFEGISDLICLNKEYLENE